MAGDSNKKAAGPVTKVAAFQIKDHHIGMRLDKYKHASKCKHQDTGIVCFDFSPEDTVAEHAIKSSYLTFGKDKTATTIILFFEPSAHTDIKAAVIAKYGSMKCNVKMTKPAQGSPFLNEVCELANGGESVTVGKYGDDKTSSVILLASDTADKEEQKRKSKDL